MALAFRDSEALQVAMRAGLCPGDAVASGAQVGTRADGAIVVAPEVALGEAALAKLRAVGVAVDAALPVGARPVRSWAEAIAPVRVPVPAIPALVLLVTERGEDLLALAAELVRLGCDRIELLVTAERGVARVVDPPTYTVVRALDREGGLRVYAPDPAGQERLWTELGYRHPLVRSADSSVRAPDDTMLLIPGDATGWWTVPAAGWRGLDAALELAVPGAPVAHAAGALAARRRVELRLAGGRREPPSLWVLRDAPVAAIDKLLAYLPEDVVARLAFAVTAGDAPIVILRARTGRAAAPELALGDAAEAYAPVASMPDVYAPATAIVEPPLRRERLRQILAVAPGEVVWLARMSGAGAFRAERIADAAFAPLADWADYVLHASAPALVPWIRATELDFAAYVSTDVEWATGAAAAADPPDARRPAARPPRPAAAAAPVAATPTASPPPPPRPRAARVTGPRPGAAVAEVVVDAELVALENEFVALDAPADAPARLALLTRLGAAYARLGRRRDAGLCFARAAWEAAPAEVAARLDVWIAADLAALGAGAADPDAALAAALGTAEPTGDDVRLVAVLAARPAPAVARDPHRVQRWLDDHDAELDARTLWLARGSLAALAGGDALALAHARDRILARLASGLAVERELPAFLRFAGRAGALGASSGEHLREALDSLAARIAKTRRKLGAVEAPVELTNAYVGLILAHGYARIGNPDRARAGIARSRGALALADVLADPVHAYLLDAFTARIEQVIAGEPPETPLPDAVTAQLAPLERMAAYVVDRLREASAILEPVSRVNAATAFVRQHDARGPEFSGLRALREPAARAAAVDAVLATAIATPAADPNHERLLDGVLAALLELPAEAAAPILARAWPRIADIPAPRRALLYTSALVAAGYCGRTELVPEILAGLGGALGALVTALVRASTHQGEMLAVAAELDQVVQRSVRTLRRIGLRAELAELLVQADAALAAGGERALRGRVALASGMAFLGDHARALPILESARAAIGNEPVISQRCALVRALALAYAHTPLASALAGIAELSGQLVNVTDHMPTNSHYCWSVLHFVESLVLGITSDDLALGEAGRRFVEDDEHLIRRRLHRDLKGPST